MYVMRLLIAGSLITLLAACSPSSDSNNSNSPLPPAESNSAHSSLPKFAWKMVTTWPPNFPIFQEGAQLFAENIALMSQDRLKITVFAEKELIPALQVFDAVSAGTIQMGHGSAYYWAGKIPAAQFMSAVPFGMTAKGVNAWLYEGGGLELWRKIYQPFNLVPFPAGNSGVQMGGWFNKRINTVQDLQGLKMRIPGLGGKVLAKAGGSPILLAGGEVYSALERGVIDATEWVGPFHDERLGLHQIARYYYYPGWHEPGTVLELIINKSAWESLPKDLQRIVEISAQALNQWMYTKFEVQNMQTLQKLKQQSQIEILPFPDEVLQELHRLTQETLAETAAQDPIFKEIYEAFRAFQAQNASWDAIADEAYHQALSQ